MPKQFKKFSPELARLIKDQAKDSESSQIYSELITPRRSVLFQGLTPQQRACLMLSCIMQRREIAQVMKLSPIAVSGHLTRGLKRLKREERLWYNEIRTKIR